MLHVVYNIKPLVVEGLKLVISIVAEHVQMSHVFFQMMEFRLRRNSHHSCVGYSAWCVGFAQAYTQDNVGEAAQAVSRRHLFRCSRLFVSDLELLFFVVAYNDFKCKLDCMVHMFSWKTGEIKETIAFSENYKCQVFEQPFSVRIFAQAPRRPSRRKRGGPRSNCGPQPIKVLPFHFSNVSMSSS